MWLSELRDQSVDAVICDPPYGTTRNAWDSIIPFEPLWAELLRVGRSSCVFVFTASQPFTSMLVMSQPKLFRHEWIWIKNRGSNFANTIREPMKEHESILMFCRGGWTYNKQMQERTGAGADRVKYNVAFRSQSTNYGKLKVPEKNQLSTLRVPSSWQKFNTETAGAHPTQKPVALMAYLVKTYTNEGDTVLDFAMGSGTTGEAALSANRNFVGIELDLQFFQFAETRLIKI